MNRAIYRLGIVQKDEEISINSLLTSLQIKHVIGIQFQDINTNSEYVKSEIYEFDKPSLYLEPIPKFDRNIAPYLSW